MAQQYDNEKRGVLFKNNRRERETQPEYTGNITINGTEYWLSAWVKEGRNGKFLSLSCQEKQAQAAGSRQGMAAEGQARRPEQQRADRVQEDDGGDIPF